MIWHVTYRICNTWSRYKDNIKNVFWYIESKPAVFLANRTLSKVAEISFSFNKWYIKILGLIQRTITWVPTQFKPKVNIKIHLLISFLNNFPQNSWNGFLSTKTELGNFIGKMHWMIIDFKMKREFKKQPFFIETHIS